MTYQLMCKKGVAGRVRYYLSGLATFLLTASTLMALEVEISHTRKNLEVGIDEAIHPESMSLNLRENFKHTILDEEFDLIKDKSFTLVGLGLFAGNDVFSESIRLITSSQISHCSVILSDALGIWYNFEFTGDPEQILGYGILPQVQIHLWQDVVNRYAGEVSYREFIFGSVEKNIPYTFNSLLLENLGKPYEQNMVSLVEAVLGGNKKEDLSNLFCSELVAMVLRETGYLNSTRLGDNYLPRDFTTEPGAVLELVDCSLMDEVVAAASHKDSGAERFGCHCVLF